MAQPRDARMLLLAALLAVPLWAGAADVEPKTDDEKALYAYGAQFAQQLQFLELNEAQIATVAYQRPASRAWRLDGVMAGGRGKGAHGIRDGSLTAPGTGRPRRVARRRRARSGRPSPVTVNSDLARWR